MRIEHRDELVAALAARFRDERTAPLARARSHAAGVPAAPVQDVAEVAAARADAGARDPAGARRPARRSAPPFSLDGERPRYGTPPPLLGEHSRGVLREAGYSDAEVEALVAAGVAGNGPAR